MIKTVGRGLVAVLARLMPIVLEILKQRKKDPGPVQATLFVSTSVDRLFKTTVLVKLHSQTLLANYCIRLSSTTEGLTLSTPAVPADPQCSGRECRVRACHLAG